jgi:hypothetical protein
VKKVLSPDETTKILAEAIVLLNATVDTTHVLYDALMQYRERVVRDAETDKAFDDALEILRLMGENIPKRITSVFFDGECDADQNAPSVDTIQ